MVKTFKKYKILKICFFQFIVVLITYLSFNFAYAQDINNLNFILKNIEKNIFSKDSMLFTTPHSSITSESKCLGLVLIKFYQLFISTQDKPSCNFTLSCSHFGMEAISYRGFFIGTLLTADRLTRCNNFALRYYKIDPTTQKAIDPVPFYEFRVKK